MKHIIILIILIILITGTSLFIKHYYRAITDSTEFMLCKTSLLSRQSGVLEWSREELALREYLKARYYYKSSFLSVNYLKREGVDFGPVDTTLLKAIPTAELGPSTPNEDYKLFMLRSGLRGVAPE